MTAYDLCMSYFVPKLEKKSSARILSPRWLYLYFAITPPKKVVQYPTGVAELTENWGGKIGFFDASRWYSLLKSEGAKVYHRVTFL